jgi:hypothetical protein
MSMTDRFISNQRGNSSLQRCAASVKVKIPSAGQTSAKVTRQAQPPTHYVINKRGSRNPDQNSDDSICKLWRHMLSARTVRTTRVVLRSTEVRNPTLNSELKRGIPRGKSVIEKLHIGGEGASTPDGRDPNLRRRLGAPFDTAARTKRLSKASYS